MYYVICQSNWSKNSFKNLSDQISTQMKTGLIPRGRGSKDGIKRPPLPPGKLKKLFLKNAINPKIRDPHGNFVQKAYTPQAKI
jgi:hypothetical protein